MGTGALWAAKPDLFSRLLLGKYSKSGSFGGPPGVRKGSDHWPTAWPALAQLRRHKQCPQRPVPAWTTLGRAQVSKRVEKGLRAWLMSTERLGAHHFSFPGLHPPARPRGTPRKYQLPGPGKAGPTWVEVRLGSPHQAIGARSPDFHSSLAGFQGTLRPPQQLDTHTHDVSPPPTNAIEPGMPKSRRLVSPVRGPKSSRTAQAQQCPR